MINSTNHMKNIGLVFILMATVFLSGCSILKPAYLSPASRYSFDSAARGNQAPQKAADIIVTNLNAPTIVVSVPRAAAGFDSPHIAYVRQVHKLEYFQHSEWVEAPATMLTPLVAGALERTGRFTAVVQSPTSVIGQLRMDLEIVRLQQEFFSVPSKVHFTLRVHLIDTTTRQVIAWREIDTSAISPSEDPYGGVLAANAAVQTVMEELARFCMQVVDEKMPTQQKILNGKLR